MVAPAGVNPTSYFDDDYSLLDVSAPCRVVGD
jgi:hypothetical protein